MLCIYEGYNWFTLVILFCKDKVPTMKMICSYFQVNI